MEALCLTSHCSVVRDRVAVADWQSAVRGAERGLLQARAAGRAGSRRRCATRCALSARRGPSRARCSVAGQYYSASTSLALCYITPTPLQQNLARNSGSRYARTCTYCTCITFCMYIWLSAHSNCVKWPHSGRSCATRLIMEYIRASQLAGARAVGRSAQACKS